MTEAKDTTGKILVPGKLYLVKMNEHWNETAYGPPYAPEKLIFQAYDTGEPRFMKENGESAGGKPSSTYVYEPVITRRPATKSHRPSSQRVSPSRAAANRARTKRIAEKRASSKGGYRKKKRQTRRR